MSRVTVRRLRPEWSSKAFSTTSRVSEKNDKGLSFWLEGPGKRFEKPIEGRPNWIARTPFPLNPTFNPRPPVSHAVQEEIYRVYLKNILRKKEAFTDNQVIQALSQRYSFSPDRIRAFIRLQEVAEKWKKEGRALQTENRAGMESALGVTPDGPSVRDSKDTSADHLSNRVVFRFEDDVPELPLLEHIAESGVNEPSAAVETTRPPLKETPEPKKAVYEPPTPGRPVTVFKDVSATPQGNALAGTYRSKNKRSLSRIAEREAKRLSQDKATK